MDADRRLILGLIFFFILFMVFCTAQRQPTIEAGSVMVNQDAGGDLDILNLQSKHEVSVKPPESPCLNHPEYTKLGYDNPYIFPYNDCVDLNLNYPTSRYRYPGWCRQLKLEAVGYKGFPGYYY